MRRTNVVYSLITNQENTKILMVKNKDNDRWTLPGGSVDELETLEAAAIREAKEETGYDIKVHGIVAVNELKSEKLQEHMIILTFRGEIVGGEEQIRRPEEIGEISWIEAEEADQLMPYYKERLSRLIRSRNEVAYFDEGWA